MINADKHIEAEQLIKFIEMCYIVIYHYRDMRFWSYHKALYVCVLN